jgi:hypothetical protein
VRDVLYRDAYRGVIIWNKRKKRNAWGEARPARRPQDDWITVPGEGLRIVNDQERQRAHERLTTSRASYLRTTGGRLFGKPSNGIVSKSLLTGLPRAGIARGPSPFASRTRRLTATPFTIA